MRRIAVQILLSYLPLVTITAAIGLFAGALLTDLGGTIGRVLAENYRGVLAAERMLRAMDLQEVARRDADGEAFAASGTAFESALADAYAGAALPRERVLLDSLATLHEAYARAARADRGPVAGGNAARLRVLAARLRQTNESAILDQNERAERAAGGARRSLIAAVVIAVLLSIAVGTQFSRRISRPLQQLTAGVEDVARGRFSRRVDAGSGGEVGALADAFNEMTRRLRGYEALNVRALLREKRTAESLVEAIPSPVVVTDEEGRLHLFNRAAEPFLAVGGPRLDAPLELAAPALAAAMAAAVPRAGGGRLAEVVSGGTRRTYQLRQTHVRVPDDAGADPAGLDGDATDGVAAGARLTVSLLDDVTPLQALDRARREFLAAVSHELRTPLTSLGIALDLLLREYAGPLASDQRELLATAKGDSDRLKALVARLLDLARLDVAGLRRGPVDIGAVVETAASGVALAAASRGVRVAVDVAPGLPPLVGDAEALGWAVSNLAVNAVRHAAASVTLRAALGPPPGAVGGDGAAWTAGDGRPATLQLVVDDDGPGLPVGAEARVFEPLVQLDAVPAGAGVEAPRPGSAGLGLTIVRRVAESHGGEAYATAGPGGHFVVALPLTPPALP